MLPSPKWKLIVDLGVSTHDEEDFQSEDKHFTTDLLNKLTRYMPQDQRSPLAEYLPGFSSIRLLLTSNNQSDRERALLNSVIACYKTYEAAGKSEKDATWMTARDFMALADRNQLPQSHPPQEVNYGMTLGQANGCSALDMNVHNLNGLPAQVNAYMNNPVQPQIQPNNPLTFTVNETGQMIGMPPGSGTAEQLLNQFVQKDHMIHHSPTMQALPPSHNQMDPLANFNPFGLSAAQLSSLLQPGNHTMHFSGM